MKVYIVRHGESVGNKTRTHQLPDMELSEEGVLQAKAIAKRAEKWPLNLIYSSNIKRALTTAKIIAESRNLKIETWDEIREMTRPSEILGEHAESKKSKAYDKAIRANFKDPDWKYSDEESFNELKKRAETVLAHLVKKHKGQNVLIVSHGTLIKLMAATAIFGDKLTSELFWSFRHHTFAKNTGVTVLEYEGDSNPTYKDGHGWSLLSWNDMSHL